MLRLSALLLLLQCFAPIALAQSRGPGVEVVGSSQISTDVADHPHVESYVAVNPRDASHLLATAMVFISGQAHAYPYASFDSGKTWARGRFVGDSAITGPGAADPIVYIDETGIAYFSTLATLEGRGRTFIARSTDGGRTWQTTVVLPNTDRQWLVVDPTRGGLFSGRIYLASTGVYQDRTGARAVAPFLARSDDSGLTFPLRTLLGYERAGADPATALNAVPMEPLVTSRGLMVLPLQGAASADAANAARRDSLNAWGIGLVVSDDGGDSFGPARYAPTPRRSVTGTPRRRLRATSANGNVRTAIDRSSGRFRDRVYFVAADYDRAIDRYVARVWHTGDFGKTWGTTVASDAPRGDIANPAIAVNRDGIVAVTWNDRRDDAEGHCWRLYAAVSADGGEHFQPAIRLSQAPTCINTPRNWQPFGIGFNSDQSGQYLAHLQVTAYIPTRFPMGGDTQGLAADGTGDFHAAWINGETGLLQLWHTSFRPSRAIVAAVRGGDSATTRTAPGRDAVPPQMEDITHDVRFRVTSTTLDFTRHRVSVTVAIENTSGRPLHAPLRVVMRHFLDELDNGMGLRNLRAANMDIGDGGLGAAWNFQVVGGVLAPGARTPARVIEFVFEGGVPDFAEGYLSPGFRVFGRIAPR